MAGPATVRAVGGVVLLLQRQDERERGLGIEGPPRQGHLEQEPGLGHGEGW